MPASKEITFKVEDNGCWTCTSHSRTAAGYPTIRLNGRTVTMGRYIMIKRLGINLPSNIYVAHTCDNPSCINPEHLKLCTPQENVDDCRQKGRRPAATHGKLTEDEVRNIRELAKHYSQTAVASMCNVTQQTVSDIANNKRWKEVR